ncbi:MAG TPA: hypothetical protein VLH59_01115 [Ignavibacteriaceae bacterium]|nr:hypothetical protein [Ignavibacteriaceae bacterium]
MKINVLTWLLCLLISVTTVAQDESGGKFSGLMFGDYFYNILRDSLINDLSNKALEGEKDLNGFQFRRIYFTYDYKISNQFSTRFRLESQTVIGVNNTIFTAFIKDAYLNWKNIFEGSNFIFGIQPPPTYTVSEDFWNYRSLERTIMDLRRIASSRDFGASLKGKLNSSGSIKYWLMYGNGSTFESEGDKFKRAYAHIELQPVDAFKLTLYSDYRFKPKKEYTQVEQSYNNDALTSAIFLGYQNNDNFRIGAESFLQVTYNDIIQTEETDYLIQNRNALGVSLFGWYKFNDLLVGIGRYDYYDPNMSEDYKGDSRNYFILGLSFILHELVSITPNILLETYETPANGIAIDPSLTGRITFYYQFL